MVREDTGALSEDAWVAADEAAGCMYAFLAIWWSSRRRICRGCPEPVLRVNDISRIYWSHLLTTQSPCFHHADDSPPLKLRQLLILSSKTV
ncbi:uncharacterized protein TNCV_4141801 [Trichonephila clavipes]|nr:uncharacterized protein TNCV_4141801 [Trichonephila clavipes]